MLASSEEVRETAVVCEGDGLEGQALKAVETNRRLIVIGENSYKDIIDTAVESCAFKKVPSTREYEDEAGAALLFALLSGGFSLFPFIEGDTRFGLFFLLGALLFVGLFVYLYSFKSDPYEKVTLTTSAQSFTYSSEPGDLQSIVRELRTSSEEVEQ